MQGSFFLFFAAGLLVQGTPAFCIRTGRRTGFDFSLLESGSAAARSDGGGCFRANSTGSRSPEIAVKNVTKTGTAEEAVMACREHCKKDPNCTHYTVNNKSRTCYLKKGDPKWYEYDSDMTATRFCEIPKTENCYYPNNRGSKTAELSVKKLKPKETAERSALECQFVCVSNKDCTHFTYNKDTATCYIKGGAPQWYDRRGDMSATRDCSFGVDGKDCFLEIDRGSRAAEIGAPIAIEIASPGDAVEECQRLCRSKEECTHVTYNARSKKCYLKKGEPKWYDYKGDMSATRTCRLNFERNCYSPQDTGSKSREIKESTIQAATADKGMKQCQDLCKAEATCTHFTFNKNSKKCYLKNGDKIPYKFSGDMTATRDCEWPQYFAQ